MFVDCRFSGLAWLGLPSFSAVRHKHTQADGIAAVGQGRSMLIAVERCIKIKK
jgi:hypothetical protein